MASIDSPIYGLAAEFDSPDSLLEAARAIRKHGYSRFEAYSPYPIKELDEVVPGSDRVPLLVLLAASRAFCLPGHCSTTPPCSAIPSTSSTSPQQLACIRPHHV